MTSFRVEVCVRVRSAVPARSAPNDLETRRCRSVLNSSTGQNARGPLTHYIYGRSLTEWKLHELVQEQTRSCNEEPDPRHIAN